MQEPSGSYMVWLHMLESKVLSLKNALKGEMLPRAWRVETSNSTAQKLLPIAVLIAAGELTSIAVCSFYVFPPLSRGSQGEQSGLDGSVHAGC